MPDIAYGAGSAPGLPPINLPALDPSQQQPLRIEVTKTNEPIAPQSAPPVRPWSEPVSQASPDEVPPVRPWTDPEPKTPEREVDVLYAKYCAAHARWHRTKLQSDQIAARETYRKWAVAFLGEADAEPVLALAPPAWGPL
jgi:hypothetical protein